MWPTWETPTDVTTPINAIWKKYRDGVADGIKLICPDIDPKFLELMVEEKMKEINK